jgi:hypothetical protein
MHIVYKHGDNKKAPDGALQFRVGEHGNYIIVRNVVPQGPLRVARQFH